MDEKSVRPFRPSAPPSAAKGATAWNRSATTSLVLGMTATVLLLAFVIAFLESFDEAFFASGDEPELVAWTWMLYLIGLVAAICAFSFGRKGRRLAKGEPGRVKATIGLVLGTVFIVVSIVGAIVTMVALSIVFSHDSL